MSNRTVLEPPVVEPLTRATIEPLSPDSTAAIPDDLTLYRLSLVQYHAIAAAGILNDDDPVELLEGLLVQKMTKNAQHSVTTQLIQEALRMLLPAPTGPVTKPDYRQRQVYGLADMVPVVIEGQEIGRLVVRELLP